MIRWLDNANRPSDWAEARVTVVGFDDIGYSIADALLDRGAQVSVVDPRVADGGDRAELLGFLGAELRLGKGADSDLLDCDLVVASPMVDEAMPVLARAASLFIPIWSDAELACRLAREDAEVPWLALIGGSPDTAEFLESILIAADVRTSLVGAARRPILETVLDTEVMDCLVVELSEPQLRWSSSLSPHSAAAVVSDCVPDSQEASEAWLTTAARVYHQVTHACVYDADNPRGETMVEQADVVDGARAIGVTTGIPHVSMMGVVDGRLVDRAFIPQRYDSALDLAAVKDLGSDGDKVLRAALMAAGLARSFGVKATAVRDGLRARVRRPE